MTMVSSTPPPFSYPISSTPVVSVPAPPGASTSPSASSLSGSGTTFPFGVGSAPNVGTGVSSTTTAIPSTSATIPGTFSLRSTPIVHNLPSSSQPGASLSNAGHRSGVFPGSRFFPPLHNPSSSQNPNASLPYGWNWTSSILVGSQVANSSYSGFGQNLGNFNPTCNPPTGGISVFFQPTPMGVIPNPQAQGGNNVPLQQPSLGSGQVPHIPTPSIPSVPMGNPYKMGKYQAMPQPYLGSYPYPPNQYMGGPYGPFGLNSMSPFN